MYGGEFNECKWAAKRFDSIVKSIEFKRNTSYRNNASIEERKTTRRDDTIYNRQQENNYRGNDNGEIRANIAELDSSFSNASKIVTKQKI